MGIYNIRSEWNNKTLIQFFFLHIFSFCSFNKIVGCITQKVFHSWMKFSYSIFFWYSNFWTFFGNIQIEDEKLLENSFLRNFLKFMRLKDFLRFFQFEFQFQVWMVYDGWWCWNWKYLTFSKVDQEIRFGVGIFNLYD